MFIDSQHLCLLSASPPPTYIGWKPPNSVYCEPHLFLCYGTVTIKLQKVLFVIIVYGIFKCKKLTYKRMHILKCTYVQRKGLARLIYWSNRDSQFEARSLPLGVFQAVSGQPMMYLAIFRWENLKKLNQNVILCATIIKVLAYKQQFRILWLTFHPWEHFKV